MDKRLGRVKWGKGQPRSRTSEAYWRGPVQWNKDGLICVDCCEPIKNRGDSIDCVCGQAGANKVMRRPRVFCASLSDWLDDEVPVEWLHDLFMLIANTPHLDWLLLTKRPHLWRLRMAAFANCSSSIASAWAADWLNGVQPHNIWVGTTVEDQTRADERIPALLSIPARVRFLSCEPLLGPVKIRSWTHSRDGVNGRWDTRSTDIHWVICGGESGPGARPMHPDWARSLRDQCAAAGVSYFFKQWGSWAPQTQAGVELSETAAAKALYLAVDGTTRDARTGSRRDDVTIQNVGKRAAGRLLDGVEHNGFPTP